MTRSTPSASPNSGLLRSARATCLLVAVAAGISCADDGTQPDDLRFGQIGRVLIEVRAPLGTGVGELQQTLSWRSDGPWESAERISYRGSLGDETVARSRDDPGTLARSYASWITLINDDTPVSLFLGADLHPGLDPTCGQTQSRVTVRIVDAQRADSSSWTRCASGSLGSLSAEGAGPDPTAGRVVQAVQLVRDYTVGTNFISAYFGSLPFATLDRGEQSNAPMLVPRVIEDAQTWTAFWDEHLGAPSVAPAVDFATELVLVAAVGTRPEAGDSVEVRAVLPVGFGTQVTLWERRSGNFCTPAARSHAPFHVVLAPQVPRPIFFAAGDVDRVPCG